jgi:hypothetical protein
MSTTRLAVSMAMLVGLTNASMGMLIPDAAVGNSGQTYVFQPYDSDLADLPHGQWFEWGIRLDPTIWAVSPGSEIESATLTFLNIWDWQYGGDDELRVHLLDNPTWRCDTYHPGTVRHPADWCGYVTVGNDTDGGPDKFINKGLLLVDPANGSAAGGYSWSDPVGGHSRGFDLALQIPSSSFDWLADGWYGFAIDPDCHYYDCGVKLTINTKPPSTSVPDGGASVLLLGLAIMGIGLLRSKVRA